MSESWKQRREAGSAAGIAAVAWVARLLGRTAASVLLIPVVAYFLLVRGAERQASFHFLGRVLGNPPNWWQVFRHFHTFARVAADRFFILTGRTEGLRFHIHGKPLLREIADAGTGCIILSSHLGSFEATRAASIDRPEVSLHVMIDRSLNPNFQRRLESLNPALAARVIDASRPPAALAMELASILKDGGWIGIPADRVEPGHKTVACRFMGGDAKLPAGPFGLACAFDVPVVFAVGLFLEGAYHLYFERLERPVSTDRVQRRECAGRLAQAFARRLQAYAGIAPYNWFNFYDFWAEG